MYENIQSSHWHTIFENLFTSKISALYDNITSHQLLTDRKREVAVAIFQQQKHAI